MNLLHISPIDVKFAIIAVYIVDVLLCRPTAKRTYQNSLAKLDALMLSVDAENANVLR